MDFEQGPIRPPSEAHSLLLRVARNCPWNRCAFCPVYKGSRASLRSVDEVVRDLDAMVAVYGSGARTAFLQDANPLLLRPDDLVAILQALRARFPQLRRVTAYARAHTLARRSVDELRRLRQAGLDRLHVGLESGSEEVLTLVDKGCTRAEQIEGGRRARQAGFELSEYVMPGLGGQALSAVHADQTAAALHEIGPHFVRLRTLAVIPGTPLHALQEGGRFAPLDEDGMVVEIRRLLAGLRGLETRLESDHALNLLMELRGDLPRDLDRLLEICDAYLALPPERRFEFALARRRGWGGRLEDIEQLQGERALARLRERVLGSGPNLAALLAALRQRLV